MWCPGGGGGSSVKHEMGDEDTKEGAKDEPMLVTQTAALYCLNTALYCQNTALYCERIDECKRQQETARVR